MSIYDFVALSKKHKEEVTFNGTLLDALVFKNRHYFLYSVEDFFVEVTYRPKGVDYEQIRPFKTTKRLERYFQHYPLPEVA
jgi:hypothetical protein